MDAGLVVGDLLDCDDMQPRLDRVVKGVAVQDNALLRSAYTMTLLEKRLLMLAISKVDHYNSPARGQPIQVEVTPEEWARIYRANNPWVDLNKAADMLMSRVVTIYPTEMNRRMRKKRMNWTDSCEYHDHKVVIRFGYSLSLELAGMIDEFAQADLLDVAKLDSMYAVRLYEMLKQFADTGWMTITVDEFRLAMDLGKKYPRFSELNKRVIQAAVDGIKKKIPEMCLSVEHIKRKGSRAVTSLKFTFRRSEQQDLFSNADSDGDLDW